MMGADSSGSARYRWNRSEGKKNLYIHTGMFTETQRISNNNVTELTLAHKKTQIIKGAKIEKVEHKLRINVRR
jgi:hypothetical protein